MQTNRPFLLLGLIFSCSINYSTPFKRGAGFLMKILFTDTHLSPSPWPNREFFLVASQGNLPLKTSDKDNIAYDKSSKFVVAFNIQLESGDASMEFKGMRFCEDEINILGKSEFCLTDGLDRDRDIAPHFDGEYITGHSFKFHIDEVVKVFVRHFLNSSVLIEAGVGEKELFRAFLVAIIKNNSNEAHDYLVKHDHEFAANAEEEAKKPSWGNLDHRLSSAVSDAFCDIVKVNRKTGETSRIPRDPKFRKL